MPFSAVLDGSIVSAYLDFDMPTLTGTAKVLEFFKTTMSRIS